jgi:hypothetical protein
MLQTAAIGRANLGCKDDLLGGKQSVEFMRQSFANSRIQVPRAILVWFGDGSSTLIAYHAQDRLF